jgi:hypothetical protein
MKDKLSQTIGEGVYQCHRALVYIQDNQFPDFSYVENGIRHSLTVDKSKVKKLYKITVTFEHLSGIAANLLYLIESGLMSEDYKWAWIVSIYDLMVFADLISDEAIFKNYLDKRLDIYNRKDISFGDELDVLGFFMNGYKLHPLEDKQFLQIVGMKGEIDDYYQGAQLPGKSKPRFKGVAK